MPIETFCRETFCDDLADYIEQIFDKYDERNTELDDKHCLGQLFRMAANSTHVSKVIALIQNYVDGKKHVGAEMQELYNLVKFDFTHNLDYLIQSVDDDPVKKDEFVQLIMSHWQAEGLYNGYLMNNDNPEELEMLEFGSTDNEVKLIPTVAALYHRLNEIIELDDKERIQIIVRQDEHYTPLDIDKSTRSCFIIDAAGDAKELSLHEFVNYSPYIDRLVYVKQHQYEIPPTLLLPDSKSTQTTSRVQKDEWSCSIYSLKYSQLSAEVPGLHLFLLNHPKLEPLQSDIPQEITNSKHALDWEQLPPQFIRLSQSPTFNEYYAETKYSEDDRHTFFAIKDFKDTREELKLLAKRKLEVLSPELLEEQTRPRYTPRPRPRLNSQQSMSPTFL